MVVPAFNEEVRLDTALRRLVEGLERHGPSQWQVVVVDDGSSDRTASVGDALDDERVTTVVVGTNRGKGAALRTGFAASRFSVVAFVDADLPVSAEELCSLASLTEGYDLVTGSRRLPDSTFVAPQPGLRRIGGAAFLALLRAMGMAPTSDPQCGVKVLRRDTMSELVGATTSDGFAFDVELLVTAKGASRSILDVAVSWRHVAGSSIRPLRDGVSTLREVIRLRRTIASRA